MDEKQLPEKEMTEKQFLQINKRSSFTALFILVAILFASYFLTLLIPQGEYVTVGGIREYQLIEPRQSYSFGKFLLSPFLIFGSSHGITIIAISLFLLILGGSFNVIDKTGGIKSILSWLVTKFKDKRLTLVYAVILFFMLFGSLFGIFEESITLLPIIIMLALSMGWDTFTGLAMCLLATGFGFSSAITNPFSVGLGSQAMGISLVSGMWYRILIFIIMYGLLCLFVTRHIKQIEKDPTKSPTYESDLIKKENLKLDLAEKDENQGLTLKVYATLFITLLVAIILSSILGSFIDALSGLSIPIIALIFLFGTIISLLVLKVPFKEGAKYFFKGVLGILPSILLIILAGSIRLVLENGKVMDTIIHELSTALSGGSPILGILFVYFITLVIQFFIGSASAKIILIIPIISAIATNVGITQNIALLSFIFGDGFTDLIYITNPILLISLGVAGFSYGKWLKKTWLLQVIILVITTLLLILGHYIGY